jgi:cytochrome c
VDVVTARALPLVLSLALLGGCGAPDAPPGGAASVGAERAALPAGPGSRLEDFIGFEAKSSAEYFEAPWFADADIGRGELLAFACRACHALERSEHNALGPNLAGVFGRAAGTGDFDYSPALREASIVWTPEALDAWLAQPSEFIRGNNMAFTGYRSASDRRDLIAYLLRETS